MDLIGKTDQNMILFTLLCKTGLGDPLTLVNSSSSKARGWMAKKGLHCSINFTRLKQIKEILLKSHN